MTQDVAQGWTGQDIDRERTRIIEELGRLGIAVDAGKKIFDIITGLPTGGRNPIKGFEIPKRY